MGSTVEKGFRSPTLRQLATLPITEISLNYKNEVAFADHITIRLWPLYEEDLVHTPIITKAVGLRLIASKQRTGEELLRTFVGFGVDVCVASKLCCVVLMRVEVPQHKL